MEESILIIIKDAFKSFFETETGTPDGKVNLLGGLICAVVLLGIIATDWIDKILSCLNKDYEAGMPWYATVALFLALIGFFCYCVKKVSSANVADSISNGITDNTN